MGTVILADVTELETVKISELPVATAVGDAAALPTVSIGKTKKIAKSNLLKDLNIPLDNVLYVAKNGNDGNAGTIGDPFLKIQAAIDYAIAHLPTSPNKVGIIVNPGKYIEQITNTSSQIHIIGAAPSPSLIPSANNINSSILYNTGADAAHYPIAAETSSLMLTNMTIMVDGENVFGKSLWISAFSCFFFGGHFINSDSSGFQIMEFRNCLLRGDMFTFTGAAGTRLIRIHGSYLYNGDITLESSDAISASNLRLTVTACNSNITVAGNWSTSISLSDFTEFMIPGKTNTMIFDTTGGVSLDKTLFPYGLHFNANPLGNKMILHCNFTNPSIADDHYDISADVAVTGLVYSGNVQQNGICGNIQMVSTEKNIGKGSPDGYMTLQDAVSSVPANATGVIVAYSDLSDLAELTLPNDNVNITINGQKQYSLAFTGDIVEVCSSCNLRFADIAQLSGGNIELNGATAELSLESCQYVTGYITLTAGAFAILYKSSLFGSTGKAALYVDNTDTIVVVGYSRIQGSTGQPAVEFSVDADNKFKAKFSTFIHGDKDASEPIVNLAVGKIDFSVYLCGLNAPWNAAKFTNLIGSAGNATDVNINF